MSKRKTTELKLSDGLDRKLERTDTKLDAVEMMMRMLTKQLAELMMARNEVFNKAYDELGLDENEYILVVNRKTRVAWLNGSGRGEQ